MEPEALRHLPLAVGVVDASGAIRYVNPAAERLYRFRAEDVLGQSALALGVAPSDTAAAADLLSRLQLGETWRGRFPLRRSDGSRVPAWVSVASMPVADEPDGEPWLLITAIEDVDLFDDVDRDARQQAAEDRAEDANLLLQGLLDSVPVGLAFWDPSHRFVRVNTTLAEINGVPAEAHVGRPIGELVSGLPPHVEEDIAEVFATGRTIDQREVVWSPPSSPDDERVWLVSYFPVSRAGQVRWVGAIALEVTDWRRGELERARLLDAEREARQAAELAAERLAQLQVVTARLAEASERDRVVEIVVHHGTEGVGASLGALCLLDGDVLELCASTGLREEARAAYERIPLDADLPVAEVLRTGELSLIGSVAELAERYPHLAGQTQNRAFAAVPMVVDGRALGVIAFSWGEERSFDEGARHFLLALGRQAAQAVERARLYEAERRARAEAEAAGERMRFLAEASRVLLSSLDDERTLSAMAAMAVPAIADACLIHLLDAGDELRLVVAAHHDPGDGRRLAAVTARPQRRGEPRLLGRAALRGESLVLDSLPDDLLVRVAENEEQLAVLRSLDLRSGIVVPLRVQDRILGVLSVGFDGSSGRRFTAEDLPFVEDLAGRAAVAIENARSHRARTEVAQTLQRSLLPPHLPRIAGLELASRYHSMGDVEVGGDFYDVFPAGEGRWGVVIGDVCGKGVGAASLTALARYTVRAGAIGDSPAGVLRLLNRAILDAEVGERFCTIAQAVVEPGMAGGRCRVVLACGGHPLPLLLSAGGDVRSVGAPGTAIGFFDEVELFEVAVELAPGDALAFYTDGFTEARSPSGEFDPGLLERALRSASGCSAEEIAEVVEQAVRAFDAGRQRDDRALLVLRVPLSAG